ncbi:hypothetical protein BAUCODRAFT_151729 [Baudoinia panamericana UAMH 10762]|uniref:Uncharacterized protein n=1 Tax=Baudoinia panamericana (strain UAMH 10762) TaxID=717646 RepID=M2LEA3_BAUPA|nr:uncharacterized protein BAUCODRAFT_151729 [Baudoinia panamericana UAMH 10762]EMC92317.1 hypothetical protein BAUCODRAFT_151729 [Baudoinia panamericana UAMH 10762]
MQRKVLRQHARWIRDDLDPQVAREGGDALHADDVLQLDELLREVKLSAAIELSDLRYSRMHLAILAIVGRATRWPHRLIERAEDVQSTWETKFGRRLKDIGFSLYDEGGRLHGICEPTDLSKESVIVKWLKESKLKASPVRALKSGDLGFRPGDWWINALLAFRDGIIDHTDNTGWICHDMKGVYAIVMADNDELNSPTPESFTYRGLPGDKGRYRLTAGTPESRNAVRILRSHTLRSFWSPKAGLRYDGLHKVTGWYIQLDSRTRTTVYYINFKRLPDQLSMDTVLARPWTEEVEDYREYKRMRHAARYDSAADLELP